MWKPAPGATSVFEEFLAARVLFREINDDARWNPWVRDDRAVEFEQAMDVMDQWMRAKPNFRRLTAKELDARLARSGRRYGHAGIDDSGERWRTARLWVVAAAPCRPVPFGSSIRRWDGAGR